MWEPDKPDIGVWGLYYYFEPFQKLHNEKVNVVRVHHLSDDGKQWVCENVLLNDDGYIVHIASRLDHTINKRSRRLHIPWAGVKIKVYDKEGMSKLRWMQRHGNELSAHVERFILFDGSFDDVYAIAKLTGYEDMTLPIR